MLYVSGPAEAEARGEGGRGVAGGGAAAHAAGGVAACARARLLDRAAPRPAPAAAAPRAPRTPHTTTRHEHGKNHKYHIP